MREHAWSVEVDLVEDTVAEGVPVGADDNVTVDDGLENPTGLAEPPRRSRVSASRRWW